MNGLLRSFAVFLLCSTAAAEDFARHSFDSQRLTDVYFSEGAGAGDLNRDGVMDVVSGPYWYAGPDFSVKREIYKPVPQNVNGYANNFFSWIYDFNGDGWNDVLVVGFPGTPAYVYQNPQSDVSSHWEKHQVIDWVSNESPQFVDMFGDEQPELVCTRDGFFGFATFEATDSWGTWDFHPVSEQIAATKFGHGLGIGDVNGDGRMDILHAGGWFEQPLSSADKTRWKHHEVSFSNGYGGAEMYAYDVDGDGDNDVITSHAAHDFGLGWYEQVKSGDEVTFKHHLIMGEHPSDNKYGVLFSELHSLNLVDMDGDGLKDIVTGKTYWSHHKQSPMWDAGAVIYWFKLARNRDGVDWIPYQVDGEAGIGRQLTVTDLNNDGLPDIVVGGMKGAHVLKHISKSVTKEEWLAAQPKIYEGENLTVVENAKALRGPKSAIDGATGKVTGAIEGENAKATVSAGQAKPQAMGNFAKDKWSGNSQLWWTGARVGDKLTVELPEFGGEVDIEVVLTCARDYGIVQLSLDDQPLGAPVDCYGTDVTTTGVLSFPKQKAASGKHTLSAQIVGTNSQAKKAYMFALDYVRVKLADGKYVAGTSATPGNTVGGSSVKPKSIDDRELNLDFETGSLADWNATGNAFEGQPIRGDIVSKRREDMRSGHAGDYWIGGYERVNDGGTGTLTSEPFVVSHPYATFLTNGGDSERTRVELVRKESGNVFYKVWGTNSETMRSVVVDLRGHLGKEIMIRLVDESTGGWGHLNFDHFRLHETRPGAVTPTMLALSPDEYPHSGLNAASAAQAMKVPEGFKVAVGASEPDVKQPIAMAIDDRGRVWVAEAYEYPVRAKGDTGRDRILIFEDTDGDGSLDKRTVFAEGLNLVSGLEVGFGGVWVGAAPYLLFIPDRNGDDVPDGKPEVLLDGWGLQDTHETLNTFIWGPDGWLYGCHGVFTHSRVGKPGVPDEKRVPLNCAVWRYHPTRHEFDVFAHGTSNPWGVDFNDHGQAFITACVIPHLYHIIQGARYQRQGGQHFNPHTYQDIVTIADHLHYLGANPHGGNSKSDSAGGGHAHSGAMIYLGDRWPAQYRNQIFMNNIHGQRLNIDVLKPNGSGYVGSHGPDFLLTGDNASQILNLRYGPDGNAWMIDWYDMQACHRTEVGLHDRSNGRIYKISFGDGGFVTPTIDLKQATDLQIAELVLHTNDWYVRHGRRVLQERAAHGSIASNAIQRLREIATTHADDTRRLRAMWALHVTGSLDSPLLEKTWADASPYVRGWAVQLAMESAGKEPSTQRISDFVRLAESDSSPIVRLYLASAAQQVPRDSRWELLESLTRHAEDANDHNLPLMYWYAAEPLADTDPTRALAWAISAGERIPLLRELMLRRIGSGGDQSALAILVQGLRDAKTVETQTSYLAAIRSALRGQRTVDAPPQWSEVSRLLLNSDDSNIRLQSIALGVTFGDTDAMNAMRLRIADKSIDGDQRLVALQSLVDAKDTGLLPTLKSLLDDAAPLKEAAIRGLAQYDDPSIAGAILSCYSELSPAQRRMALGTLCSRAQTGIALLGAIESRDIAGTDLTADLITQLQFLKSKEIDEKIEQVWGSVRQSPADKLALMTHYKSLVESTEHPQPDMELGRSVFADTCMKCHQLYGVGFKIGPDLTGSNRSNLDYLLSNIVDPSSVMAKEYRPTVVLTEDGRVVNGLVVAENEKSLTLQTTDAQVTIPKAEIEERVESEKSMMPEDQLKQFSEHQIRSLVAYLRATQQTPMLATSTNAMTLFNGTDLSGWTGAEGLWTVENGDLVGRTDGLKRNEWIVSHLAVENFHLTLEIKLVDNAGNSGIQFRSKAIDGEVHGYQADVGQGWWGKLYEEHGRALLWDQSGEAHVKPGEWNRYEIIADGHRIRTLINGQPCVDLDDPKGALRGIIAFQLHSGGKTEVRLRNMQLQPLP